MCTNDCNQGRACTCGPQSLTVNLIGALIWVASIIGVCAVLLGVIR